MKKHIMLFVLLFTSVASLYAQNTIKGEVVDESGQAVIGATVFVKGSNNGTTTAVDGSFSLPKVAANAVLEVSYIGYENKEMAITGRDFIRVQLVPSSVEIEEVVAIGYGTMRRRDLTGAVGSISSADINNTATANYDQALAGRIAGVQVSSADGTPGDGLNIVIRGGNSITGDNSPLYVIDGVAWEDFDPSTISSNDIETLDVLKDASSTAIYGSRGANGVVLITTKSGGTDGKTTISARASYGYSYVQSRLETMSAYDYMKYISNTDYAADGNLVGTNVTEWVEKWGTYDMYQGYEGTSWQDEIMRVAPMKQANISLNTGTKTTSIYYSGEYLDQDGGLLNTGFFKVNNNLKFTHNFGKGSRITGQMMYTYTEKTGLTVTGNNYLSVIRDAIRYRPVESSLFSDENVSSDDLDAEMYEENSNNYLYNPVKALENTDRLNRNNSIRASVGFQQKLGKAFTMNFTGSYNGTFVKSSIFYNEDTQQAARGNDGINASLTEARTTNYQGTATLNYNYNKKGHKIVALVGTEALQRDYETYSYSASQFSTDIFGLDKLQVSTTPGVITSLRTESTMASVFSRVNYTLRNKYLFTANFRADGSSKFLPENRWGYFPSASFAWRASEEKFLKSASWLSNLKVRTGWGLTGNNRVGDYTYLTYLTVDSDPTYVWGSSESTQSGVYLANMGVDDLTWETTAQTSVGVDFGALNNKISVTLDYYYKHTYDLLLNADMATSTGYEKIQQNIGEVSNRGWEFTLSTVNISKPKFQWSTTFNISTNKNRIEALNDGQDAIYTELGITGVASNEYCFISQVGQPVGLFYGLQYDRLYSWDDFNYNNETGTFSLKNGVPDNGTSEVAPGSIKYIDQNGDGTINEEDRVVIGDATASHFGGITNDFVICKNFDVSIFFQWSYGNEILNANNASITVAENKTYNGLASSHNDVWTQYNTETDTNAIKYQNVFGAPSTGNIIDDRYVEDGSYLKLKSVSVGYTFPKRVISSLGIDNLRLYVSAQNLYTWTNYSGYDPDVSVGKSGALTPGLDYSAYPQSTTILAGIDLKF